MKYFLTLTIFLFIPLSAQVNTERFRRNDAKEGFAHQIDLSAQVSKGNSNFIQVAGTYRTDFVRKNHHTWFLAQYRTGKQKNKKYINRGFLHLREMYRLNPSVQLEFFTQKEFDEFLLLKNRFLLGTGVRYTFLKRIEKINPRHKNQIWAFVGMGLMYEKEDLRTAPTPSTTKLLRSTNYLSVRYQPNEDISLDNVWYFQPAFRAIQDYRILGETNLSFRLSDKVAFLTTLALRYDHEPPTNLKPLDLNIQNGLSIKF